MEPSIRRQLPTPATAPQPAPTETTDQPIDTSVSWANGGGATSYNVYFGTDSTPGQQRIKGQPDHHHLQPRAAELQHNLLLADRCGERLRHDDRQRLELYHADRRRRADRLTLRTSRAAWAASGRPTAATGTYGRNEISNYSAMVGSNSWRMDVTANGNYSLNELVLKVSLSGATSLGLGFCHARIRRRAEQPAGDLQRPLQRGRDRGEQGRDELEDAVAVPVEPDRLDELHRHQHRLCPVSPQLNGDVYIKFQQYDNYAIATDGILWDDIKLATDGTLSTGGSGSGGNTPPVLSGGGVSPASGEHEHPFHL